jgi:hypothetical protein
MRKHYSWIIAVLCYALFIGIWVIVLRLISPMGSRSWQVRLLSHLVLACMIYVADCASKFLIRRWGLSLEQEEVEVFQKYKGQAPHRRVAAALDLQLIAVDEDNKKPMTQRERIQYYVLAVSLFLGMGYLTLVQLLDDIQQRRLSSDLQMYALCFLLSALGIWLLAKPQMVFTLVKFDKTFSTLIIRRSPWAAVRIPWKEVHHLQLHSKTNEFGTQLRRSLKFYNRNNELIKEIEPSFLSEQDFEAVTRFVQGHLEQSNEYSTNALIQPLLYKR